MNRSLTTQSPNPALSLPNGGILQRQCASCGQHTIAGGECTNCARKKSGLQRQLTIGSSNDPLEREADRVADQVMAAPVHSIVSDAPPRIQRYTGQVTEGADTVPASVDRVLSSPGRPLDPALQQDMGQRFGYDFSQVRVHTGVEAEHSAREINANAYTRGHNIVFGTGQFAPSTDGGRRLLAHELTHVVQQQANMPHIQRAPDPAGEDAIKQAAKLETEILADPNYKKLRSDSKARVRWIIDKAKTKSLGDAPGQRNYYLDKLKVAITTPFEGKESGKEQYDCSETAEKENRQTIEKALEIEKLWWDPLDGAFADVEEKAVASGTKKVRRAGQDGKIFYVDRSDPKNIRVQIKVKLKGKPEEVASIKKLEDAIEREVWAKTKGYYLDIVFVNKSGFDVFEFTVQYCQWPNSGNWAADPLTLSHEVHHALGLEDRYDYIESHADNRQMNVAMRLVWFVEQMKKTSEPRDPYSKMDTNSNPLLAEDVCAVAFKDEPNRKKCIDARKDLDPVGIPPL